MMEPSPEDLLHDAFLATPEMETWDAFMDEGRAAIEEGKPTVEMPTSLLTILMPELTSPMTFQAFRDVWNRLCDERNQPELKKHVLVIEPDESDEIEDGDGPF